MRGHPKTFTSAAPLFGKHVGTFYWGDGGRQKRDNKSLQYQLNYDDEEPDVT